jgi:putative transposase
MFEEEPMKSAAKIPLLVSEQDACILDSQSRIANWLYNQLLERANDLRQRYRATQDMRVGSMLYTERGLRNLIPDLKEEHPFLRAVYSSVLKNAALRLSKAIQDYQDGKHGRPSQDGELAQVSCLETPLVFAPVR